MNEKTPQRRPATFKLDDPGVVVVDTEDTGRLSRGTVQIVPEAEPAQLPATIDATLVPVRRGFRWGTLLWSAVAGLVVLGTGLGVINLVEDLFARNEGRRPRAGACGDRSSGAGRRDHARARRIGAACVHRE